MLGSYRLFLQIAQVSVQMAQDHIATAFHFLISKRLPPALPLPLMSAGSEFVGSSTSMASTSAICKQTIVMFTRYNRSFRSIASLLFLSRPGGKRPTLILLRPTLQRSTTKGSPQGKPRETDTGPSSLGLHKRFYSCLHMLKHTRPLIAAKKLPVGGADSPQN